MHPTKCGHFHEWTQPSRKGQWSDHILLESASSRSIAWLEEYVANVAGLIVFVRFYEQQ